MGLTAIANFIYEFYCFLHRIVTFICYIGYLLYYIICKVVWFVQNVTIFAQIVYEDNRHFIQDTKTLIVGTSDFFIANIGKVGSGIRFIGTAFFNSTISVVSLLKLIVWSAKQSLILIGDAVWLLITAPYQLLVTCYRLLIDINLFFQNDGLGQIMHYLYYEMPVGFACILVALLVLIYQFIDTTQLKLTYNLLMEKVRTGVEYSVEAFGTALLHFKLARRVTRVETVPAGTASQSTVGICIICQEYERTVAFIPCGHLCVCKDCARTLMYHDPKCPLCRSYINQRLEVYI